MLGEAGYAQRCRPGVGSEADLDARIEQGLDVLHVRRQGLLFYRHSPGICQHFCTPRWVVELGGQRRLQRAPEEWLLRPVGAFGKDVESLIEAERRDIPDATRLH